MGHVPFPKACPECASPKIAWLNKLAYAPSSLVYRMFCYACRTNWQHFDSASHAMATRQGGSDAVS